MYILHILFTGIREQVARNILSLTVKIEYSVEAMSRISVEVPMQAIESSIRDTRINTRKREI